MKDKLMSKKNMELQKKDKRYTWHPFTQMMDWETEDITIVEKGEGMYLEDVNGSRYIDGVSSLWTNVHGHRKRELDDALRDQIGKIAHSTFLGLSNVPAIELSERLISVSPRTLKRVFYCDSGSEAVEVALKVAYQYQCQKERPEPQRTSFLHLTQSYHGDTLGSVSVGGIDVFHNMYQPLLFETVSAPAPYCYRCPFGKDKKTCVDECFHEIASVVHDHHEHLAGIVIEPLMQGAAGMIDQPAGFVKHIRQLADSYGLLLICDEVATGFGKTGTLFACEREQVCPDILALGKGITGGYLPLSATLFTEEIFDAFLGEMKEGKTFYHGHTYTANQLACRAALASLDLFDSDDILAKVNENSRYLAERLRDFYELAHVGDIRQAGIMTGIELVADPRTKEPYTPEKRMGYRVVLEARRRGVIIRPLGDVIVLMPALAMPRDILETLVDETYEAIRVVTGEEG